MDMKISQLMLFYYRAVDERNEFAKRQVAIMDSKLMTDAAFN